MRNKILKLKEKMSLYDMALDIGISESSLYNYLNSYRNVSTKTENKIREYFKKERVNENTTRKKYSNFYK